MVVCTLDDITKVSYYLGLDKLPEAEKMKISNDPNKLAYGFGSVLLKLGKQQGEKRNIRYLGSSAIEEAQIRQWVEYAVCSVNFCDSPTVAQRVLKELNSYLAGHTYLVGNRCTLADAILYCLLIDIVRKLTYQEKEQYLHLSRWFNNLQQDSQLRGTSPSINFSRTALY